MTPPPPWVLQLNTVFNGGGTDNQALALALGTRRAGLGCGDRLSGGAPHHGSGRGRRTPGAGGAAGLEGDDRRSTLSRLYRPLEEGLG
jgi:hypothetical protein